MRRRAAWRLVMRLYVLALFSLVMAFGVTGCQSVLKQRPTTLTNISTRLGKQNSLSAINRALEEYGWRVVDIDWTAGIISTEPQEFAIDRKVMKGAWRAKTSLMIVYSDNDVQVQMAHQCQYDPLSLVTSAQNKGFDLCVVDDAEANHGIDKHEARIVALLRGAVDSPSVSAPRVPSRRPVSTTSTNSK